MGFNEKIHENIQQIIKATSDELHQARTRQIKAIPKHKLASINCAQGQLLSNRDELIKKMPSMGVVAELGADKGEFSSKILEIVKPRKLHIIDAWHTERYDDHKAKYVAQLFREQVAFGQVDLIRSLSVDAAKQFKDSYFDWIYIDTDHSYDTTLAELLAYERTIKKEGFICGHDYVMGNWITGYKYGVIEAVAEFCVMRNWRLAYLTTDFTENNSFALARINSAE